MGMLMENALLGEEWRWTEGKNARAAIKAASGMGTAAPAGNITGQSNECRLPVNEKRNLGARPNWKRNKERKIVYKMRRGHSAYEKSVSRLVKKAFDRQKCIANIKETAQKSALRCSETTTSEGACRKDYCTFTVQ